MKKQPIPRSLIESAKRDLARKVIARTEVMSAHTGLSQGFCARLITHVMVKR